MLNMFKVNNKDDVVDAARQKMRKIILILPIIKTTLFYY